MAAAPLEVNALITAAAGAMAGAVARFVVGPLDVVKIRFQVQLEPIAAGGLPSKYTSLHQAFTTILREEGIKVRSTRMPPPLPRSRRLLAAAAVALPACPLSTLMCLPCPLAVPLLVCWCRACGVARCRACC